LSFNSNNLVTAFNTEENDRGVYAVTMSTTTGSDIATLGGTAWSENIGWVSFDRSNTGNPPQNDIGSGTGPIAQFNTNTGKVEGWARALAGDSTTLSGWDGWISLSSTTQYTSPTPSGNGGVTFASTTGSFNGFAWGSDVVGWLDFRLVSCGTDCGGTPPVTPTNLSGTCSNSTDTAANTVTWTINPSGGNGAYQYEWNLASQSTVATYTKLYTTTDTSVTAPTITLYDTASPQESLVITCDAVPVNGATTGGTGKMWLNNDPAKSLNVIKILTGRTTKVNWGLPTTGGYTCNRINTTNTLPGWLLTGETVSHANGSAFTTSAIPVKGIYDIDIQCTRASPAPISINLGPVKIIVTDTILGEN
jgi:hypothetical protein